MIKVSTEYITCVLKEYIHMVMIESCHSPVGSWLINNHSSFIEVMVEKTYWRYGWTKTRYI